MTTQNISAVQTVSEPTQPASRAGGSGTGFVVPAGSLPIIQPAPVQGRDVSKLMDASAILALQEEVGREAAGTDAAADREARRRGRDILDALAAVQKDLLVGVNLEGALTRLNALADVPFSSSDPGLAGVIAAIRLRARLELIRLARTPQGATCPESPLS